jgi:hypothetical protein
MAEPKKCGHANCTCICTDGTKYCSQYCEDSKNMQTIACKCPHPDCGGHT